MCTGILFLFIFLLFWGRGYMYYVHKNRIPLDIEDPIGFRYIFVYQLE